MRAERPSLSKLGLLPDTAGQWPMATWLDHTHARPAHDALKRLIASPLSEVVDLRMRQALLQHLVPVSAQLPWTELQSLAAQVHRYLSSNYELIPTTVIERASFAMRYGHIVTDVAEQLRAVNALIRLSTPLHSRLVSIPADASFGEVVAAFAAIASDPRSAQLRGAVESGKTFSLIAFDTVVRATQVAPEQHAITPVPLRVLLQNLVNAIWQLDAFCSLAVASHTLNGVLPELAPRGAAVLAFAGLRHPQLPSGVSNDLQLDALERVLFLTGPNMAGKSTLLRALGIAVYCAHLGMAVAARTARVPLFDQLMVSITVRDSLQRGESLYLAEIRRVRAIIEAVERGDSVVAIFDEVFRGTNITDASQATSLLVDGLSQAVHGTFVIASHLADVGLSHAGRAGVACWCMEADVANGTPVFTHRVGRGVSDVQLGMILLDAEEVGPMLRRMAAPPSSSADPSFSFNDMPLAVAADGCGYCGEPVPLSAPDRVWVSVSETSGGVYGYAAHRECLERTFGPTLRSVL